MEEGEEENYLVILKTADHFGHSIRQSFNLCSGRHIGSQYMVTLFIFEWEILSSKFEPKELNQKEAKKQTNIQNKQYASD